MTDSRRKKWISLGISALPAVVAAALYLLLPHFPNFTETVMSGGVFRWISVPLGWLVGWVPFSLTELLVVVGVPTGLVLLTVAVVRFVRTPHKRAFAVRVLRPISWTVSCLLFSYMLLHGANYYRLTAAEKMNLDVCERPTAELAALCEYFAAEAAAARAELGENPDGTVRLQNGTAALLAMAGDGYAVADDEYTFLWGATNRVKPVMLSHAWSYTGITGMYFPMLAEANANVDQPLWCVPFTASHELAHTRGFAREDECNFFAYLSCTAHPSADYRYSGYYMAYIYSINALNRRDPRRAVAIASAVDSGVRRDLMAQSLYWDEFEGPVQEVSDAVNSGFISSQGVSDGTFSYGRCVDLLLAYHDQKM